MIFKYFSVPQPMSEKMLTPGPYRHSGDDENAILLLLEARLTKKIYSIPV
jgi:hypothetical protein